MIAKLTVAASAFIVVVAVAAGSAFVAYRQGLVRGLGDAERAAAAQVLEDVEIASAIRTGNVPHALRLLDMGIDSTAMVLHSARQNVGVVSVLGSGADSAKALSAAKRYRSAIPSPPETARDMGEAMRDISVDRASPPSPSLAALLEHRRE
jgi:hypothetical protein